MATKKQTPLLIANWKMHPSTVGNAKKLFLDIRGETKKLRNVETIIAAPFPYITELRKLTTGKHTGLAAQDVFWEKEGAFTGEVSASMLRSVGVSHVIIGHSERRAQGETDEEVNKKVQAALKAGLVVVLCVGESDRDHGGAYLGVVETQIRSALNGVPKTKLNHLCITYEPVWAISTSKSGHAATPEDAHEMALFIQKVLTDRYTRDTAQRVRILYGGSVDAVNIDDLLARGEVDGYLVGGASLRAKDFTSIAQSIHAYNRTSRKTT